MMEYIQGKKLTALALTRMQRSEHSCCYLKPRTRLEVQAGFVAGEHLALISDQSHVYRR